MLRVVTLMALSIATFWLSSAFSRVSSRFRRLTSPTFWFSSAFSPVSSSNLWRRSALSWSVSSSAV